MTQITAAMVKELRAVTGAGPLDCKKALQACDGDFDGAIDFLREKGLASAAKKLGAGRAMNEGVIQTYQHFNHRLGVMVEVNCETDFVASAAPFQEFARNVALHIANMAPEYVRREDVPEAVVQAERDLQLRILQEDEKNARKPEAILEKIIEGRMGKFFAGIVLMEQEFLLDDSKTVAEALAEAVALLGESMEIRRFARFAVGEDGNGAS
ncbi:MAG: translation elongation factor Ts [Anaerolineaceae bacterium]|nr:translation elongation factor Ts [Anaerolineaceae bacterium]MDE0328976.1 translation elongation factor Ts [Anaerolineaceae bacterium]